MTTSSRVRTETNVTEIREAVAPNITIQWNPVTNDGWVVFHLQDMITRNGAFLGLERHTTLRNRVEVGEMVGTIKVPITEIMETNITLGGQEYPGILLMGLIKSYFEQLYTTRLNLQDENDAPQSPPE